MALQGVTLPVRCAKSIMDAAGLPYEDPPERWHVRALRYLRWLTGRIDLGLDLTILVKQEAQATAIFDARSRTPMTAVERTACTRADMEYAQNSEVLVREPRRADLQVPRF